MSKSLKVRPGVSFDGKNKSLNAEFTQKNTQVRGTPILIQNYKMSSSLLFPDIFLSLSCLLNFSKNPPVVWHMSLLL